MKERVDSVFQCWSKVGDLTEGWIFFQILGMNGLLATPLMGNLFNWGNGNSSALQLLHQTKIALFGFIRTYLLIEMDTFILYRP